MRSRRCDFQVWENRRAIHAISFGDDLALDAAVAQANFALKNWCEAKSKRAAGVADTTPPNKLDPPKIAEFLLTALSSPSRGEAMVGDLNECFAEEREKFGRDRAVRLYWARTVRSLWPLLRRAIGKALKWGAVIAAVRRMF